MNNATISKQPSVITEGCFKFLIPLIFLYGDIVGVDGFAKDEKALKEKLGNKIDQHVERCYEILVPTGFCQYIFKPGTCRRENGVVCGNEQHAANYVRRTLKRVSSVDGEIPKHAEHQSDEVTDPIIKMQQFVQ